MSGSPVYTPSIDITGILNHNISQNNFSSIPNIYYSVYAIHNAVYDRNIKNGGVRITDEVAKWYTGIMNRKNQPSIINGGYSISPLSAPDKALTVLNNESSGHVYQQTYTSSSNWSDYQYWTITHVRNGQYKIINNRSGKALQVARGDTKIETPIIQFPYVNEEEQLWKISIVKQLTDGDFKTYECVFTNVKTGQVMDMAGSSKNNHTEAIQFPYHGGNNQRFILNRKWS